MPGKGGGGIFFTDCIVSAVYLPHLEVGWLPETPEIKVGVFWGDSEPLL